jgi:F-type H+-transporting ATPase subunit gamma
MMANLKDIQRQIKSVANTKKTTRAMKLVSTAKLRRAEELAKKSRVYAVKLNEVLSEISARIAHYKSEGTNSVYFKNPKNPKMVDIIFVTADKGLCGGFNTQTIKEVNRLVAKYKTEGAKVRLRAIGKKGISFFDYQGIELTDSVSDLSAKPDANRSAEFMDKSIEEYKLENTDKIIIVHNGYANIITQEIRVNELLPMNIENINLDSSKDSLLEIEAEDEEKMLNSLVEKYIEFNMYYALIDSLAAEHSARMQAMDAATNNASDMLKKLNVEFNKARQAAITTELIEIISGVESMK